MSTDYTALLMMSGSVHAAYQIGTLCGTAGLARERASGVACTPFDIICGASAGAINSLDLACGVQDFTLATEALIQLWGTLHTDRVYHTDVGRVGSSSACRLTALAFGWMTGRTPYAPFDNTLLCELLESQYDGEQMQAAFDAGTLHALVITALSYTTGRHVTFYQSPHVVLPWWQSQRITVSDEIDVSHMLALLSIPFVFPAESVPLEGDDEWFGGGTMRQTSSLSPATHLSVNHVLMVDVASRSQPGWYDTVPASGYPSLVQIAGQALVSIFLDGLSANIERLQHVSAMVARSPEIADTHDGQCKVEVPVMVPSERIEPIASRHVQRLPDTVHALLRPLGDTEAYEAVSASYPFLGPKFTQELIDLGERNVQTRRDGLAVFLYDAIPDTMRAA